MSDLAERAIEDLQYLDNFGGGDNFCYIEDDEALLRLSDDGVMLNLSLNLSMMEIFDIMNSAPMRHESRAAAFALAFLYKHPQWHNWIIQNRYHL